MNLLCLYCEKRSNLVCVTCRAHTYILKGVGNISLSHKHIKKTCNQPKLRDLIYFRSVEKTLNVFHWLS